MDLRRLTAWHLWAAGSFNQRLDARLGPDDMFTVVAEASEAICMGTLYVEYPEYLHHCTYDRNVFDACRPWHSPVVGLKGNHQPTRTVDADCSVV